MTASAPCCAADRQLLVAGGGGDHPCAHRLAELDGGQADAPCRAQHQQRFARPELRAILQRVQVGAVGHHDRRGGVEVHRGGHGNHGATSASISSAKPPKAPNAITRSPGLIVSTPSPTVFDDARHFAARRKGQRRLELIEAPNDQGVGEVDPARLDGDHDLPPARCRWHDVLDDQGLGRTVGLAHHGSHDVALLLSCVACPCWRSCQARGARGIRGTTARAHDGYGRRVP